MTFEPNNSSNQPVRERGVYTLANDVVVEWFLAFVQCLQKTNPTLPLTVIPYNKSISKLQALKKEYPFTIMEESECGRFDALEAVVMGQNRSAAMFRKWACFFGHYINFVFLDADIIVTSSLDDILGAFSHSTYDLIYFDANLEVVYTPKAAPEMVAKYGSAGFIAGAFASRKGTISYNELLDISQKAAGDRDKFIIDQVDQPFLNYVFDASRRPTANVDQLLPTFAASTWARQPFIYDSKTNMAITGEGKLMPFIHWAGCAYPTMVRPEIFLLYRTSGLSLPARLKYNAVFYFRRYTTYFLRAKAHWTRVITQFLSSKAWRKFYLCKMIGIKLETPT